MFRKTAAALALKAALCQSALVLGDIPSLRELWDEAAAFVGPDDPDALVSAIRQLIDEPARLAGMMTKARARALAYRPRAMGAAYMQVYRHAARLASVA